MLWACQLSSVQSASSTIETRILTRDHYGVGPTHVYEGSKCFGTLPQTSRNLSEKLPFPADKGTGPTRTPIGTAEPT